MDEISQRKNQHLEFANCTDNSKGSVFDSYKLHYFALPELNYVEIDTKVEFLGTEIAMPFLVSSMTGGVSQGDDLNRTIATACSRAKVPFCSGSIRIAIEQPELLHGFDLKPILNNVPYLLNVGAMQLKQDIFRKRLLEAVKSLDANGVFVHINPLQEIVQMDGDKDWTGGLEAIKNFVQECPVPVFVKEVGHGLSIQVAEQLFKIGVKGIDVSGRGGLSWGDCEAKSAGKSDLAKMLSQIGYVTPELLLMLSAYNTKWGLIAGGGIRSGLDVVKALVMGARLATAASPIHLVAKSGGTEGVLSLLANWKEEIKLGLFSLAAKTVEPVVGNHSLLR